MKLRDSYRVSFEVQFVVQSIAPVMVALIAPFVVSLSNHVSEWAIFDQLETRPLRVLRQAHPKRIGRFNRVSKVGWLPIAAGLKPDATSLMAT